MDLRHLRHFVAVAEELHFAKAARRLEIAQPPLSQSIIRLEGLLGVKLLERNNRRVNLAPAGTALLAEARKILAQAEYAERLVQGVAAGVQTRLRVGFVPMSLMRTLPAAIRTFRQKWPGVEVLLSERGSVAQVDALRSGGLDLGIVIRGMVTDAEGLELKTIDFSRYVAAIPAGWEVAHRPKIRLADLKDLPLVMFPQQMVQNFFATFEAACRRAGFAPKVTQQAGQPYTMLNLVANYFGVGVMPESARFLPVDGVVFVPIGDMPEALTSEVALAWVPRAPSPTRRAMIDIIVETSTAKDSGTGRVRARKATA